MSIQIKPRAKDCRGIFAIYPLDDCWMIGENKINLSKELVRIMARRPKEAIKIARARLNRDDILAIEVILPARIVGNVLSITESEDPKLLQ
jgi:hypothetical protein